MSDTGTTISRFADELICSADLDGYYTDVNPAFVRLLGWSEPELVNRRYIEYVHPDDRAATVAVLQRLRKDATRPTEIRNRYLSKDGREIWIDWSLYRHGDAIYGIGRERAATKEDALETTVLRIFREQAAAEEKRVQRAEREKEEAQSKTSSAEQSANAQMIRARALKVWIAALTTAATAIGGAFTWAINRVQENAAQAYEAEQRRLRVDSEIEDLKESVDVQGSEIQQLRQLGNETQVQVSESIDYVVRKIDAAHPRTAAQVPEPPTVEDARTKANQIIEDRGGQLFRIPPPPKPGAAPLDVAPELGEHKIDGE